MTPLILDEQDILSITAENERLVAQVSRICVALGVETTTEAESAIIRLCAWKALWKASAKAWRESCLTQEVELEVRRHSIVDRYPWAVA